MHKYCVIGFSFLLIENKSNGHHLSENGGGAHNASFAAWKDFTGSWSVHVPGHMGTVCMTYSSTQLESRKQTLIMNQFSSVQFRIVKFWKIIFPFNKLFFLSVFCRDAMKVAEEAEKEIMKAAPNVFQVSVKLRLGRPIPEYQLQ